MKKSLRLILAGSLALSVTFISCKKTDTDANTDQTTELSTHSDDQARFSEENDAIANDANIAIENFAAFQGRVENTLGVICNATAVMDSTTTDRRITVTYNGLNCWGTHFRTGVVVLTMPLGVRWVNQGAVLTVNVQNLQVTRLRDNKTITINGSYQAMNVTGGRLSQLSSLNNIVHELTSPGMTVTFDNGSQRSWRIAKRRTFTYSSGIVITTVGMHTDGNTTGISEWGTNRFGNPFVTVITQPMVIRQDCAFRLVSGEVSHQRLAATVVVTFGLDAAGNPTSCPGLGVYYFKLVWTGANGIVRTLIWPY